MIIKIIPIKEQYIVANTILYIAQSSTADKEVLLHNLFSSDGKAVEAEYLENFNTYARKRKNRNRGYHIILSLSPLDRAVGNKEMLEDIAQYYIEKNFSRALVYGKYHNDKAHHHIHLLVSSNNYASPISTRQSKADLYRAQRDLLSYITTRYPQLQSPKAIDLTKWGTRQFSEQSYYKRKRNPALLLTKDALSQCVQHCFRSASTLREFYELVEQQGLTTYRYKGEVKGVLAQLPGEDGIRKFRFERLGISKQLQQQLSIQHHQLAALSALRHKTIQRAKGIDFER